jgi:hypothetical protein
VSLTARPLKGNLTGLFPPGTPFGVTAIWPLGEGRGFAVQSVGSAVKPGVPALASRGEFALAGHLAEQVATVEPEELPIVLCLLPPAEEEPWRFEYLGKPRVKVVEQSRTFENPEEAVAWLGDGEPVEPEQEEPYRFDPTPHMDFATAPPPTPVPEPLPVREGPPLPVSPLPPTPVPEPGPPLGSYGDRSIPFGEG